MSFKQIVDGLTGKTYSSNVAIVEKTHFNGKVLRKEIWVEETADGKKKFAKNMDKLYPKSAPHKPYSRDYRFIFLLDLTKRPSGIGLGDLLQDAQYSNYYKPLMNYYKPTPAAQVLYPAQQCVGWIDYTIANWLEIRADHTLEGEVLDEIYRDVMEIFPISYESVFEIQSGESFSFKKEPVVIEDYKTNKYIQRLLIWETLRFLQECKSLMSP